MPKKQSSVDYFLELFIKSILAVYFIIANAYLGSQLGWWSNEQAWIFTQGMLIVLGFLGASIGLNIMAAYIIRRVNPPPSPQPKKLPPQRAPFLKRHSALQQHGWSKAKNDRLNRS